MGADLRLCSLLRSEDFPEARTPGNRLSLHACQLAQVLSGSLCLSKLTKNSCCSFFLLLSSGVTSVRRYAMEDVCCPGKGEPRDAEIDQHTNKIPDKKLRLQGIVSEKSDQALNYHIPGHSWYPPPMVLPYSSQACQCTSSILPLFRPKLNKRPGEGRRGLSGEFGQICTIFTDSAESCVKLSIFLGCDGSASGSDPESELNRLRSQGIPGECPDCRLHCREGAYGTKASLMVAAHDGSESSPKLEPSKSKRLRGACQQLAVSGELGSRQWPRPKALMES
ncbi:hypothetical protein U0070_019787 [Myodes glareolus]|uniref:Uncharacterized protein n=1 Tax=Myodes glareolus TaxID=447135 RepID=A0AAW0JCI5_MYOGA